jgi:hypothetical protein
MAETLHPFLQRPELQGKLDEAIKELHRLYVGRNADNDDAQVLHQISRIIEAPSQWRNIVNELQLRDPPIDDERLQTNEGIATLLRKYNVITDQIFYSVCSPYTASAQCPTGP